MGRNYLAHIREMGNDEKLPPMYFAKAPDMVVDSGSTIPYPPLTNNLQHEVELVVALKSGGADIPVEKALDHVWGYAVGFDMTRRDLQQTMAKAGRPWEVGKSFDNSGPCGALHPVSEVGHLAKGRIQVSVNGQVKQGFGFGPDDLGRAAYYSSFVTTGDGGRRRPDLYGNAGGRVGGCTRG